jgi:Phage small terminase subunit
MLITVKHKQKVLSQLVSGEKVLSKPAKKFSSQPMKLDVEGFLGSTKQDKDLTIFALEQDLSVLHDLVDVSKKIELKKNALIPKWIPIVDEYINSGAQHPYAPLVFLAVWLLDAEKLPEAITYADYAIKQQQPMPDRFKRDLPTFMAAGIHDWAQRQLKAGHSAEPYFNQVIERIESKQWLVDEPIVLGFMYKLAAQFSEKDDLEKAESFYLKCVNANPQGHGVKTKLSAVQRKLGKPLTLE